jgi:arginyl-tRNA synthetase
MQNILSLITEAIHTLYGINFTPDISVAPKPELGEYCTNVFPLAKTLGKAPNLIADEIATELTKEHDTFVSTSATGGYVNFFLTDRVWITLFESLDTWKRNTDQWTIVVDYIGMNVGKPPHIGHICTPLQWQAIINIMRYLGYHVIWDSHLGDWGFLFGKLIVGFQKYGDPKRLETDAIDHLLEVYIAINTDAENDPAVEQTCRDAFRALSDGNTEYTELWARFTRASITTAKKMLSLMHVKQDFDVGESFYEWLSLPVIGDQPPLEFDMNSIVTELVSKGIATQNEDGSIGVIFPEDTKMPSTILRKRDGTNLYLTSDLAAIKYRLTNGWNPIKILYFVDIRQQLHLKQAFWIATQAWPELLQNKELFHAANGALVLPEWAMSTRKWNIIRLDALVEEGFLRTKNILEEKGRTLSEDDIREIAVGAIKYSYLSQDRERNIVFGWDKALNFEGNSGPYIQYAYVRAMKLVPVWFNTEKIPNNIHLSPYDRSLIQILARFDEVIENTVRNYKPHHLALYCYDLAVAFNSFYVHTPKILDEKEEWLRDFRLSLCQKFCNQIRLGFELLAIKMPTEM